MLEPDPVTGVPINPVNPTTINEMTIGELERLLTMQRDTRLSYVRKLEALTQVKIAAHLAQVQLKFEKQVERVQNMLKKFEETEDKVREGINKLRIMQLEFGEE